MPSLREVKALNRGVDKNGRPLSAADRSKLLKPYLPEQTSRDASSQGEKSSGNAVKRASRLKSPLQARTRLNTLFHTFIYRFFFFAIQFAFSTYLHARQIYHFLYDRTTALLYYHHRTPELIQRDIKNLTRVPKHLSVIVELRGKSRVNKAEDLARLVDEVAEIAAWCSCARITTLSVYEKTGILKTNMPLLRQGLTNTYKSYFPPEATRIPHVRAPNRPSASGSPTPSETPTTNGVTNGLTNGTTTPVTNGTTNGLTNGLTNGVHHHTSSASPPPSSPAEEPETPPEPLDLLLLSASDGRATLVDLTKTLAEMAQRGKLAPQDITADLIDAEIRASVCTEPDLLIVMAPSAYSANARGNGSENSSDNARSGNMGAEGDLVLRGYPPWQVRLTEIYHVPDHTGGAAAGYQIFLGALRRYSRAEMRFGR